MPYPGELAALSCSLFWALCSLAFAKAGRSVGGSAVNQIRIYMAVLALTGLHLALHGIPWPAGVTPRQVTLLLWSGLAGLALGDLCLFLCMAAIGPRIGTLLMATSPAMTATIAAVWLDESLGSLGLLGMALSLAGVGAVLWDRRAVEHWQAPANRTRAVLLGLAGALGQSIGLILAKSGMAVVEAGELPVDPLGATWIRMVAGAVGMAGIAVVFRQARSTGRAMINRPAMRLIAVGALFGPILGVWMSMVSVRHAEAGIAATLMSLAPVLMLPIARIAYGSRPGPLGITGTLLAVTGCALLFVRG